MAEIFDLFGEPVPANWGERGRPQHIASQQNRNRVSMLVAMGWSNARIAAALFVTLPTLRKHYFSELKFRDVARDRLNATMATKLWELFMSGNVAAGKEFRDFVEKNDLMLYGQTERPAAKLKAVKLGKKEEAALAAHQPDRGNRLGDLMARRQDPVN
ncbi:hypothetical protein [Mesorhizobium sp. B2-3-4]|uniref:hypothetical protein n=1 Tax=Mesorhizobium sp. B2-3-4 TaxID=2589959 RepID=UPI00112A320C|nr:hypothetical protein [Mesorhizobium sp. B2-3-4]TPM41554.1 hypothetical protein FJ967_01055 [Mesorhizobium sp. B2-3-4]